MSDFAHDVLGLPKRYVKTFYGRTFADVNAAAAAFIKLHAAHEITSQLHETTGGWSATIYYELPEAQGQQNEGAERE